MDSRAVPGAGRVKPDDAKWVLAANVRRLRKERGWSQEMLAHFAGLHPTEVSRLERGLREPRLRTVMQLAGAFRCSVLDIVEPHEEDNDEDEAA